MTKSGGATSIKKIENVFFDFAWDWKNVRRIAYAPSFGLDTWGYSDVETKNCAGLVKKFNLVTVREESAVGALREAFRRKAYACLGSNDASRSKGL